MAALTRQQLSGESNTLKGFVASWFFPPSTSSEGIVAFKLLSHSEHHYDVCSSLSNQWGYDAKLPLESDNITPIQVDTDDIAVWVEAAVEEFEKRHAQEPYDFIMTRSMPPESIIVGERIKQKYPDVPWIASLGDPISRVPHMMRDLLDKTKSLTKNEKQELRVDLNELTDCSQWVGRGDAGVDLLCQYKKYEITAIKQADMLVFPNAPQAKFMLCGYRRDNVAIVSHSYDEDLYAMGTPASGDGEKVELVFLGQAYKDRSVEPFIHALNRLRDNNPYALEKLHVRFIGLVTDDSKSLIWNYCLNDVVSIEDGVSYFDSLAIMKSADWLLHVDGWFNAFSATGGSVYLAGKLADYVGARKPILAITGQHSPADRLIRQYGGYTYASRDIAGIADALERIALGTSSPEINEKYASWYSASEQASLLDRGMAQLSCTNREAECSKNADSVPACAKLLSICIPSYNVEHTLARCLNSLLACAHPEILDILVVNDGSHDRTAEVGLRYENEYPGIVRLIDKENGGHGSTINEALKHAKGDYFRVVDGDDWLDPDELTRLLDYLQTVDEPVDLIVSDYCQINMTNGEITRIAKKSQSISYDHVYAIGELDLTREYFSLGNSTYRTGLLRECSLKLFEHCFYVDVQFQMQPLPYIDKLVFLSGNLYHYAIGSTEQSVNPRSFVNRYENHDRVMRDTLEYYFKVRDKMKPSVAKYYEYLILNNFLKTHYTISLVFDRDRERGLRRAHEFDEYLRSLSQEWYRKAGEMYTILPDLRQCAFDPKRAPKKLALKKSHPSTLQRIGRKFVRKLMHGGMGDVVAAEVKKRNK